MAWGGLKMGQMCDPENLGHLAMGHFNFWRSSGSH